MKRPVVILGAGGHGRVLLDALRHIGKHELVGFTEAQPALHNQRVAGLAVLGDDEDLLHMFGPHDIHLVNGIGAVTPGGARSRVFERFRAAGYTFMNVIHPKASVGDDVRLGEGVQIMAGAVVQSGAVISDNVLINSGAVVEHDCLIARHVHIATRAALCGGVQVGELTHVGAGATVIQGMQIGVGAMIAAGAVVVRPVRDGAVMMGVPAREHAGGKLS